MDNLTETYKTKDFYLAAFLITNDKEFYIEDAGNGIKWFVFDNLEFHDREKIVTEFYKGEFIQKYITAIKTVKREMYKDRPPIVYDKK